MKKIILGSLLMASLLYAQGEKQVEITQNDINIQNKLSDSSQSEETVEVTMDDFFNSFKDNMGIEYGETNNGVTFFYGTSDVLVQDTDPNFAKSVSNAYQKAMLNLQANFIKEAFGRITPSKLSETSNDGSTNNKEFDELPKGSTFSQILDKIKNLAGAKLDSMLAEYGIKPDGLTEERKKILFQENFLAKEVTKAFGQMKGLVAVQTHLTKNKHGQYQVGVIAVISDKTRQIATDMALGRQSLIKGKNGKKIQDFLPKEKAGFINEYGTRLVYDENGEPVILSYGNWGYRPVAGNNRMTSRLEETAKKQAESQADAAIIEFININVSLASKSITGEEYAEIAKQTTNLLSGDVTNEDQTIANTIDKFTQKIKANSSGKLRGIRTAKTWDYTSDNGVEHVGVVRYYSFKNYQNTTEAIKGSKPTSSKIQTQTGKSVTRSSQRVNTIDDF